MSFLEARHQQVATAEQKAWVAGILKSAADAQAPELLMSFDNEVPEKLADFLSVSWQGHQKTPAAAQVD